MTIKNLLTIVMPYADGGLITRALHSVESQLVDDRVKVLLVADGKDVIETPHKQIVLPWNTYRGSGRISSPGGIPRAIGTIMADSEFVTYLDQDNLWEAGHLAPLIRTLDALENQCERVVVYTMRKMVDPTTDEILCKDDFESIGPSLGISFVDTNCMTVRRAPATPLAGYWAAEKEYGDDRLFCAALDCAGFTFVRNTNYSILYRPNPRVVANIRLAIERGVLKKYSED